MSLKKSVLSIAVCVLLAWAYIIQKGDTLWDLSEEYLGDPFAWPDIWQVNPYIEDPHWIYPDDYLCIPGESECPGINDKEKGKNNRIKASSKRSSGKSASGKKAAASDKSGKETPDGFRKHEPPKILNPYYQRLMPILEPVADRSNSGWFLLYNDEANKPIHHSLEHDVLLGFGKRTFPNLQPGDLAELWSSERISIPNAKGSFDDYIVRRLAAIAKITGIGDSLSRAKIVQSFDLLSTEKAITRPQPPVPIIDVKSFESVKQARVDEMSSIIAVLNKSIVVSLYSYVLLNKGKTQKYVPGSVVAFWDIDKRDASLPPRLLGRGIVVHSDNERSIVLIRDLYNASRRVDVSTPASLTHLPVVN